MHCRSVTNRVDELIRVPSCQLGTSAHRSTSPSACAKGIYATPACIAVFMLLAGCGSSANNPVAEPPPIAAQPDVIVTIDGERHECTAALFREPHGSTISCDDVVPFVRDELRLPKGSIYDLRTISNVDEAQMAKVGAGLQSAGYRFIGGPRAKPAA